MEKSGIRKGHCYEGAGVSSKHVLALVNNGNAKASDIIELARASRKAVKDKFGITLEPEVQFVGISL
jgi:UDP-N-acetylmuramate dehydrogenase